MTTSDIFFSTLLVIVFGLGFVDRRRALSAGFVFFRIREESVRRCTTFTDAGGMTRLNLDGFTPDITPKRCLDDYLRQSIQQPFDIFSNYCKSAERSEGGHRVG